MLAMTDTPLERFLPVFAETGAKVAFLVPTPTGYEKSIMDAVGSVRELLKSTGLHDYESQEQGQEHKRIVKSFFVNSHTLIETTASLYRPITKHGDPRIWFSGLKKYCSPKNLLALIVYNNSIYVMNLSNDLVSNSLLSYGFVYDIVKQSVYEQESVARELLQKLIAIHNQGFLPSITEGDPGVGDTLENALGIHRNNSILPDYKGIELKCTRITRGGRSRGNTRVNLFANVPDTGLSYAEIVKVYGKWVYNEKKHEDRLSIVNTTCASHPNSHGLILYVNNNDEVLELCHTLDMATRRRLSVWYLATLKKRLLEKHHETFWVQALSVPRDGIEYFRYDKVIHTKNPNDSLIFPLLEADKIQVDLAGYYIKQQDMKWRDHGMLFKMWPSDLPLLFGEPQEYDLSVPQEVNYSYIPHADNDSLMVAESTIKYGNNKE